MQKSQELMCNKGPLHHQQLIRMICLNQQCEAKRLCCLVCIDQLHRKHQLVSIKKFETSIKETLYYNQFNPKKQQIQQIIISYENTLHDKVAKLKSQSLKGFDNLDLKISQEFRQIYITFNMEDWDQIKAKYFGNNLSNQMACEFIKRKKNMQHQIFTSEESLKNAILSTDNLLQKYFDEGLKQIKNSLTSLMNNVEKIRLGSNSPTKLFLSRFNKVHKASNIIVNQSLNTVQRTQSQGNGGYPIALSQHPLNPAHNQISFVIDEQPGNFGVWIGVCILDIVKQHNFVNCYGIGKGTYAIDQFNSSSSTAYSWNNHDVTYNSKPIVVIVALKQGWNFGVGEIVTISVDFINATVKFKKGQFQYTQPIKLDSGDLYGFAGPTNVGDKISIAL